MVSGSHLTPSQTLAHLSNLQTTERAPLKAHAIVLATGKSTSLLGMLDLIELET